MEVLNTLLAEKPYENALVVGFCRRHISKSICVDLRRNADPLS